MYQQRPSFSLQQQQQTSAVRQMPSSLSLQQQQPLGISAIQEPEVIALPVQQVGTAPCLPAGLFLLEGCGLSRGRFD